MNETVTDAELRAILERIGEAEFGGNPRTTVRDIVEATSADPKSVGSILAQVRKEYSHKDQTQSNQTPSASVPAADRRDSVLNRYPVIYIHDSYPTKQRITSSEIQSLLGFGSIAVVAAFILIAAVLPSCDRSHDLTPPYYNPAPVSSQSSQVQPQTRFAPQASAHPLLGQPATKGKAPIRLQPNSQR